MNCISSIRLREPDAARLPESRGRRDRQAPRGTLMKRIGIAAIYRRPNTSRPARGHKIYPYLLRGMTIDRADQVWAMDMSYIPMARGFVYLTAVVDVASRRVLAHRVSITMEATSASRRWKRPSRSRATGHLQYRPGQPVHRVVFTGVLLGHGVAISMDGRGAWRDNVFVERVWRSVKYEEVYLRAYDRSATRAARSVAISPFTIIGARIRALTGARRTRPTSRHRPSRRRHEFSAARGTCLRSGYALPPSRPAREIAKDQPRQQST